MLEVFQKIINENRYKIDIEAYIYECYVYYKKQKKSFDDYYKMYDEINASQFDTSPQQELKVYSESKLNLIDEKGDKIIETNLSKYCFLEGLKRLIEDKSHECSESIRSYTEDFQYYPDTSDKDFIKKITSKKEFYLHQISRENKTMNDICDQSFFELQSHQLFLKNFLSNNTPYNGLLIFHGVGVGKTCSGVSIAENFKDIYGDKNKRIIVLSSSNIKIGWRKTIFNPSAGDNQCTGDTYQLDNKQTDNPSKKAKKMIKTYYDLYGYGSFASSVKRLIENHTKHITEEEMRLKEEIKIIKKYYSNRVLIIDEAHNIKNNKNNKSKEITRDTILYIEKVIRYSDNLKLILLTANPMFNQPTEITWILNMLLINDKKTPLNSAILFDEKDELTEEGSQLLQKKCKGYISYLRGENPISFPIRLYPYHDLTNKITHENSPQFDLFQNRIPQNKRLSFLELYSSPLQEYQERIYTSQNDLYKGQEKLRIEEEGVLLQLSNIAYPNEDETSEKVYGDEGFDHCFTTKSMNRSVQYSYKLNCLKKYKHFMHEDYLSKYSAKIATLLNIIKNSDGIVFIYTNYLKSGIIPIVLALEQNGYQKYDGNVILNDKNKKEPISIQGKYKSEYSNSQDFIQAKYMVIAGGEMSKDFEEELKVVTDKKNKDGKDIKIIIGSTVASEGLDFKCIRSIHLLEPWHNINKLEQVIGRGIRNCSHTYLDNQEDRNVTIYLHSSTIEKHESIDTYLYRYSERKAKQIGLIENILKQNAIDKYLFHNANYYSKRDVETITTKPCYRSTKSFPYSPNDKSFTRVCSFQKNCNYLNKDTYTPKNINKDTFSLQYSKPLLEIYKKRISLLFLDYYSFTFDEIKDRLLYYKDTDDILLYHSLYEMIHDKYIITSPKKDPGYLIYSQKKYIYQPFFNEDKSLPLYYRANKGLSPDHDYTLPDIKKKEIIIPEIPIFSDESIQKLLDKIKEEEKGPVFKMFESNPYIEYSYFLERLHFDDKRILLFMLLKHIQSSYSIQNMNAGLFDALRKSFSQLFIYYDEKKEKYYHLSEYKEKNKSELFGAFLYHPHKKMPIFFKYVSHQLLTCNRIEISDIINDFKDKKYFQSFNNTINWGYLSYSSRWVHYTNGMVFKVSASKTSDETGKSKDTFPPGEGVIIMDPVPGWYVPNMYDFIKSKEGLLSVYNKLTEQSQKKIEKLQQKMDKKEEGKIKNTYSIFIELSLRHQNRCIHPDLIWLKYIQKLKQI